MKIGVMVGLTTAVEEEFRKVKEMGIPSCQLACWDKTLMNVEMAEKVNHAVKQTGIEITAFWCGWEGPAIWDSYDGPLTLGLVPPTYRYARMLNLMQGVDFAVQIGVVDVITHVGFIPEDPNQPEFHSLVSTLRYLVSFYKQKGRYFLFETGQETPVTLLRTIEEIGMDNIGINLDPANLILYGKGNPVDALDVFGKYVRGVHAKDGIYPTTGRYLGEEKPLGEGKVNFPALVARLKSFGYRGALTIEREISGDQQIKDILSAKKILENLISQ